MEWIHVDLLYLLQTGSEHSNNTNVSMRQIGDSAVRLVASLLRTDTMVSCLRQSLPLASSHTSSRTLLPRITGTWFRRKKNRSQIQTHHENVLADESDRETFRPPPAKTQKIVTICHQKSPGGNRWTCQKWIARKTYCNASATTKIGRKEPHRLTKQNCSMQLKYFLLHYSLLSTSDYFGMHERV